VVFLITLAEEYDRLFAAQLAALDPREVFEELGDIAVLLYHEKDAATCHWRVVTKWLEQALGIKVSELEVGGRRSSMAWSNRPTPSPAQDRRPSSRGRAAPARDSGRGCR
jgi:hypothetical protein